MYSETYLETTALRDCLKDHILLAEAPHFNAAELVVKNHLS